ncbi:MAG: SDR family NAD(P)-dependent oxidoreductase [Bacteroidales bacterium]|nr:SDR family NAD(P)-dependent oxidoreductase [Bacteroidales bacterium]
MDKRKMLALVTGASSGMGREYAVQLAAAGHDLLLVSNEEKPLADTAAALASAYGVSATPLCRDLAAPEAADELYGWCRGHGLQVDILINNAGMFFFAELRPEDEKRVQTMMNLHMVTPTRLCLLFGGDMKARGRGYIINVSSLVASLCCPGIVAYAATKAYLKTFSRSLYFEMRPYGVHVTTVCPAAVATSLYGLDSPRMAFLMRIGAIKTPAWLVRRALRGMWRGRAVVRPGLMNIYLPLLVKLLPLPLEERIWKRVR